MYCVTSEKKTKSDTFPTLPARTRIVLYQKKKNNSNNNTNNWISDGSIFTIVVRFVGRGGTTITISKNLSERARARCWVHGEKRKPAH